MPQSLYTKLTPTKRNLLGYTQLWLGPDHLLLLTSTQFAETYKRFAFCDIQSIVLTELPLPIVPQVIAILAALAWMALWFAASSAFAKWAFLITGALALLWAVIDIARGQRCRCYLQTRVSKELLAPVSRTSIARKFLAAVRPRIEAAQGVLTSQQFDAPTSEPAPPPLLSPPGYIPEILFGLFLVDAILVWATVRFPDVQEISSMLVTTLFAELVLIVVALLRRAGRDNRVIIYIVVTLSIIFLASDLVTIGRQLGGWYITVLDKAKQGNRSVTPISIFPDGPPDWWRAFWWRAVAGVVGLGAAFYERRKP